MEGKGAEGERKRKIDEKGTAKLCSSVSLLKLSYLCFCPLFLGGVSGMVYEERSLETAGTGRAHSLVHTL